MWVVENLDQSASLDETKKHTSSFYKIEFVTFVNEHLLSLLGIMDTASSRRCGAETDPSSDVGGPVDDGRVHKEF